MTHALAVDSRSVMLELHHLLRDLDPSRFRDELREAARERVERIAAALRTLLERDGVEVTAGLRERIEELWHLLEERAPRKGLATMAERRAAWAAYYEGLKPAYEAVAAGLRGYRVHVPSLRPTNYARNIFHICWAFFALFLIEILLSPNGLLWAALGFAGYGWTMEAMRRVWPAWNDKMMALYGKIAHPHEWHQINSATWYATALVALALTRSPLLCAIAVAVLGIADPAAAFIGRRYGRIKLLNGRSLEGSMAFVVAGVALAAPVVVYFHGLSWSQALLLAWAAAVTGAVAELVSKRVDDNFSIPVAAAAGAWLAAFLTGISIYG